MDEKQPTFTVTDKRKFTLEGDLRDESSAAEQRKSPQPHRSADQRRDDAGAGGARDSA